VRMLQPRCKLNLPPESIDVDAGSEIRRQNLDYNLSLEVGLCCDKDARHSRATQLAVDPVCGAEYFLKLRLEVGCHGPEYSTPGVIPAYEIRGEALSIARGP